ncbi:uncharacterized protein [Nicotiana tomentosiformis]|uniref:uncharacterized protein n=1 Tax=Nicotiana tomentosiformis TaxID=4098 RepID=UPI00388C5A35
MLVSIVGGSVTAGGGFRGWKGPEPLFAEKLHWIYKIDLRTDTATKLFTCGPPQGRSYMPVLHIVAMTIDPRNSNFFAVAGSVEFARIFDIRKYKRDGSVDFGQPLDYFCPSHLIGDEDVGITGLAFSDQSELLVSYLDEFLYLFTKDMELVPDQSTTPPVSHDTDAGEIDPDHQSRASPSQDSGTDVGLQVYKGHINCQRFTRGVNCFGPKCEYVVSGSDCGRIFIWKKKSGKLVRVLGSGYHVTSCIEPHPYAPMLATYGFDSGIEIWTPTAIDGAVLPTDIQKGKTDPNRTMNTPSGGLLVFLYGVAPLRLMS